jgi:hypothetical protein
MDFSDTLMLAKLLGPLTLDQLNEERFTSPVLITLADLAWQRRSAKLLRWLIDHEHGITTYPQGGIFALELSGLAFNPDFGMLQNPLWLPDSEKSIDSGFLALVWKQWVSSESDEGDPQNIQLLEQRASNRISILPSGKSPNICLDGWPRLGKLIQPTDSTVTINCSTHPKSNVWMRQVFVLDGNGKVLSNDTPKMETDQEIGFRDGPFQKFFFKNDPRAGAGMDRQIEVFGHDYDHEPREICRDTVAIRAIDDEDTARLTILDSQREIHFCTFRMPSETYRMKNYLDKIGKVGDPDPEEHPMGYWIWHHILVSKR